MSNIYLVGFMGTGKTEVARLLAGKLRRPYLDMDEMIQNRQKMPIAEIFKSKGEAYFRQLEKEIVRELSAKDQLVVACGGGAFVDKDNIEKLKKSGTVICLTSTPETILKRTSRYKSRPLINVQDPKGRIEKLLKKRASSYAQAHHVIDADQLTVEETAQEILKRLGPVS
jgi:shikimate kinase